MKRILDILKLSLLSLCSLPFVSCDDWFEIKPESEITLDDLWKHQSDVESAIGSCYRGMIEPSFIERLIVWGELRSDNVIRGGNPSEAVRNILSVNLDPSNDFAPWAPFYSVINFCNTVLLYAPGVRDHDPEFKEGALRAYIAEAKTVRALCYFYLVRTFNNVPYITEPYADDTEDFSVEQTDGDEILRLIMDDLKSIEYDYAKKVYSSNEHTKGRITQKALWALMADIALWQENYQDCIDYCDKCLEATDNPLQLEKSTIYNQNVFITGNSKESIFEIQLDKNNPNYVVNELYGTSNGRGGYNTFQLSAYDFTSTSLFESSDIRGKDAFYPGSSSAFLPIMKYIAYRSKIQENVTPNDYQYQDEASNWIFYRLSDIYLMKAEALVERNNDDDLKTSLSLVSRVYDRAHPSKEAGSLSPSQYNNQESMRNLVLDERQREFIFEGKRYYDLLRIVRRDNSTNNVLSAYLLRKYAGLDQSTVISKLNDVNAFYFPISKEEIKINKKLKQNPFYETSSSIVSNNN